MSSVPAAAKPAVASGAGAGAGAAAAVETPAQTARLGNAFTWWMKVLAVIGHAWLVVAIAYVWTVRSATGISTLAVTLALMVLMNWLAYGALTHNPVLVLSGTTGVLLNIVFLHSVMYLNGKAE